MQHNRKFAITTTLFCLFVALLIPSYATTISSTFDVNDEGWIPDGAAMTYESVGGNSGGFLKLEDNRGDSYVVYPPSKYMGDLSQFNGGLLSYDILVFDPSVVTAIGSGFGRIQINSLTFDYAPNPPLPSSQIWTTYSAPMTAEAWSTTEENWLNTLSDIHTFYILLDLRGGTDTIGFDNFKIESTPSSVPEPSTLFLYASGLIILMLIGRKKLPHPNK